MNLKGYVFIAFAFLISIETNAQQIAETRFADYISGMPAPQATIMETLQQMGDDPEKFVGDGFKIPTAQSRYILQSFFERFKNSIAETQRNRAALSHYSPEEQKLMQSFKIGTAGFDESGQFSAFALAMESRPLAATGKLSWTKLSAPLSAKGQSVYQQVLQMEKALNWAVFYKGFTERDMLHHMFATDDEIRILNEKMELEKEKIPMRKVKIFEQSDVTTEVQDPEKMAKLLKDDNERRQLYFQRKHNELFTWWNTNKANVEQCAGKMDALLDDIHFGSDLTNSDRQLIPIIADVQERIWQAFLDLNSITRTIVQKDREAAALQKVNEDAIEMYQKMKVVK